jgi:hypothetical protein
MQDKKRFPDGAVFMTWGKRTVNTDEEKKDWFRKKVEKLALDMDASTVPGSCMQRIWNALTASQQSLRHALVKYETNKNMVSGDKSIFSVVFCLVNRCRTSCYLEKHETRFCPVYCNMLQSCIEEAEHYQP